VGVRVKVAVREEVAVIEAVTLAVLVNVAEALAVGVAVDAAGGLAVGTVEGRKVASAVGVLTARVGVAVEVAVEMGVTEAQDSSKIVPFLTFSCSAFRSWSLLSFS
ncbi:MAG TPA: hypothetical protein VGW38_13035, partial [Chloroflexota bacterium]|nr:hypothetical protein [Chloroflexota bacterium]